MTDQLMVPHYRKIEGLQMRTAADFTEATMTRKSLEHVFKLDVARARPSRPSLVGSAIGRIDKLLLTVPALTNEAPCAPPNKPRPAHR